MSANRQTLEEAMAAQTVPTVLPKAMPIAHMSKARWFPDIMSARALQTKPCEVFSNEELLYFFYGGQFYRPKSRPTQDPFEWPVAFLFDAQLLKTVFRYFPFDTGAVSSDLVGPWRYRLGDFKTRYAVYGAGDGTVPRRLVHHIFETNERYLRGSVSGNCHSLPDPFPELYEFLTTDITQYGADDRKMMIECQMNTAVSLQNHLLWVAYPDDWTPVVFHTLVNLVKPTSLSHYPYPAHSVSNPADLASRIRQKAEEYVLENLGV